MECKQEKTRMTVAILQVGLIISYSFAFAFVIIVIGLFGKAQDGRSDLLFLSNCPLFFAQDNVNPAIANCNYVFVGEALTSEGLFVLIILGTLKLVLGLMKNVAFLIADIIWLVLTSVFAVTAMIVLCAGWGTTCNNINDLTDESGFSCSDLKYYNEITAAAVFSGLVSISIALSIVMYVVTAVMSFIK